MPESRYFILFYFNFAFQTSTGAVSNGFKLSIISTTNLFVDLGNAKLQGLEKTLMPNDKSGDQFALLSAMFCEFRLIAGFLEHI